MDTHVLDHLVHPFLDQAGVAGEPFSGAREGEDRWVARGGDGVYSPDLGAVTSIFEERTGPGVWGAGAGFGHVRSRDVGEWYGAGCIGG